MEECRVTDTRKPFPLRNQVLSHSIQPRRQRTLGVVTESRALIQCRPVASGSWDGRHLKFDSQSRGKNVHKPMHSTRDQISKWDLRTFQNGCDGFFQQTQLVSVVPNVRLKWPLNRSGESVKLSLDLGFGPEAPRTTCSAVHSGLYVFGISRSVVHFLSM